MAPDVIAALRAIRGALLNGNFAELSVHLPALQAAEAGLPGHDLETLRHLKAEAERTETCLQAALTGARGARRRLVDIADAMSGLTTYDRDGTKATVAAALPRSKRV